MDLSSLRSCFPKPSFPLLWSNPVTQPLDQPSNPVVTMASTKQAGGTPVQDPPQENSENQTGEAIIKEMEVTSSLEDLQT